MVLRLGIACLALSSLVAVAVSEGEEATVDDTNEDGEDDGDLEEPPKRPGSDVSVDEALNNLPPAIGEKFVQVKKQGSGGVPLMVAALNEVYLRALEDHDALGFRCQDSTEQASREVEDSRSALKQAERSLTLLRDRMQSMQSSNDRSMAELEDLRTDFEAKRAKCQTDSAQQDEELAGINKDLAASRSVFAEVTATCDSTGGVVPPLAECKLPDGSYLITFSDEALRTKVANLGPLPEKLLTLQLERLLRSGSRTSKAMLLQLSVTGLLQKSKTAVNRSGDDDLGSGGASFLEVGHLRGQRRHGSHRKAGHKHRRVRHHSQLLKSHELLAAEALPDMQCTPTTTAITCESFSDYMNSFVGGVEDLIDELKMRMEMESESCRTGLGRTTSRINELKRRGDDASVALANLVTEEGELTSARRERRAQVEDLTREADHRKKECTREMDSALSSMCSSRALARELQESDITLGGTTFVGNCEVTEWAGGPCSASCGGGKQNMTRRVVRQPPGLNPLCPPLQMLRSCNTRPCPVDGIMGRWEEWSSCSRACGAGTRTRYRKIVREPMHGGLPTGETMQQQLCNTNPCDQDCLLADWTAWSTCSKACNRGHRVRVRNVANLALVGGECPAEDDPQRRESKPCNKKRCAVEAPLQQCQGTMDLALVLDSSGSMGEAGSGNAKNLAVSAVGRMLLGEEPGSIKVGVITFGSSAAVSQPLTVDAPTFVSSVNELVWDRKNTNTGEAVAFAGDLLLQKPRVGAQKVIVVVTDSMPLSTYVLNSEAKKLRDQGIRIAFVLVGHGVGERAVQHWASWPFQENVISLETFAALEKQETVTALLANICPSFVLPTDTEEATTAAPE